MLHLQWTESWNERGWDTVAYLISMQDTMVMNDRTYIPLGLIGMVIPVTLPLVISPLKSPLISFMALISYYILPVHDTIWQIIVSWCLIGSLLPGDGSDGEVLGLWCDSVYQVSVYTSQPTAHVLFVSDGSIQEPGFRIEFSQAGGGMYSPHFLSVTVEQQRTLMFI